MVKINHTKPFPIVGMGGSAGSFHAFETFFKNMVSDSGMAFVIVMHLDPNHKGNIVQLMQNYTAMTVLEATDGMPVEPNMVYIIPPNADMGVHSRRLLLLKPAKSARYRMPIDYFLQSLAEDQWNKVVAIIFSGMGSDGETGVRMVKEKLGMAMAQDPETAQYPSMPVSAIETNLVDYVVSPEEMPAKLLQYINHPLLADDSSEQSINEIKNTNAIQKIMMLLRSHTGHDFSLYKKSTITRRIDRRIAYHQINDYGQYVSYLRENQHEIDVLFQELLIGVTKFFRDPQAYDALQKKLYLLLAKKNPDEPIRVWVAGCSTGEEAYSVAILIMEFLNEMEGPKPRVQIFATDLDTHAIEHARTGVYRNNIIADVSPERIENFFVKNDDWFTVKKELREMIVFAQHNIIKDAPFTKLDLLCCRNVMIYLTAELQQKIIPVFHYSLNVRGLYFMGPAETLGGFTDMFTPVDSKWKIFDRKEGASFFGKMIDFPFHTSKQLQPAIKPEIMEMQSRKKNLGEFFNQMLIDNYTPSSVLVNEKGDIVYSNGKAGKFLELPAGEAVMNIYQMAREELKYALSNAIHQAIQQKGTVIINDIKLQEDLLVRLVNLKVNFLENTPLQGLILVIFEDKGLQKKSKQLSKGRLTGRDAIVEEMEKELIYTKQQLHTTIEQMETSLEELKSTNEELQSTNEEMQSTNEEALTTKEEMQSLNEELMTINMQYQIKADQLTQLNNDMKNMLDNTEIGTIFLDNSLNILRFTPQIKKLFNVIPSDVGRSITHIVSNSDYPSIEADIREVIERLVVKEVEIKTKLQDWYNLRIMPYRTMDNFIHGAVLTINRITHYKQLEQSLHIILKYMHRHIDVISDAALIMDKNLKIVRVNQPMLRLLGRGEQDILNTSFADAIPLQWQNESFKNLIEYCTKTTMSAEIELNRPSGEKEKATITASPYKDEADRDTFINLIFIVDTQEK